MSILAEFKEELAGVGTTREITVTNRGKEKKFNIRSIGFRDRMKFQSVMSMKSNSEDGLSLNLDAYADYGVRVLSEYIVEVAGLSEYDLKELGMTSREEFVEKYFDGSAGQTIYNEIMEFTKKTEDADNEKIGEIGEEIKN